METVMKRVLFALVALTLSGCFLEQHKPNPPVQGASGAVRGIIAIEDVKGVESFAVFKAFFANQTGTSSRIVRQVTSRPEQSQCKVNKKSLKASSGLISVGQLSFGTALQSTHLLVEENTDHEYKRYFSPDFPTGTYNVAAKGTASIPGFQQYIQVPEALQDVSVNGQAFGSSSVLIRKADTLVASWRQPTLPNSDHLIFLDIETKTVTLNCIGIESSFEAAGGSFVWRIAPETFAELPTMKDARILFVRGLVSDSKNDYLNLQVQGLRTWYTAAEIGD
jgi:hypothetical protein